MSDIRPFTIAVPDDDIDDLRRRLAATRWPEAEAVDDLTQGIPLAYVQEVCEYWRDGYDWRRCEAGLNAHPNFMVEIDGLDIHFQHVRSPHDDATAARAHPRVAGFDRRVPEGDRPAHRPDRPRRHRR